MPDQVFNGAPYDKPVFNNNGEYIGNETEVPEISAKVGFHGLSIQVYVSSAYPKNRMKQLLEKFHIFHGPLKEVTITGSVNPSQARSIEASITASRDAENMFFHKLVLQLAELTKKAGDHVSHGTWVCALVFSN
jgi:hypothetical protein